jgi:Flp pilus assembly protein TadD
MSKRLSQSIVLIALAAGCALQARAGDTLKITIPKRSELTPVQKLNREGVDAVRKQDYEKASTLFYKAYLYDPADPFTLNNLGYISELQGELERARRFYALAAQQGSDANIDRSNAKQLVGKPMELAFRGLSEGPMQVNRMNVDAMNLLNENRGFEAVTLLQKTLSLEPKNPFTLNNLGVAEETVGDYEKALHYYSEAAGTGSREPVVVTEDRSWRGKPIHSMAAFSANRLQVRMDKTDTAEQQAARFTLLGVTATNENDWSKAKDDFLHAYSLDPNGAFSLNNRGFVAEMEGDLETAQFFYDKAQKAGDSRTSVGLATLRGAEGKPLSAVASDSDHEVDTELERYSQQRRRQTGPIELTPRENTPGGAQQPQ